MTDPQLIAFACLACFILACLLTAATIPAERWLRDHLTRDTPSLADRMRAASEDGWRP